MSAAPADPYGAKTGHWTIALTWEAEAKRPLFAVALYGPDCQPVDNTYSGSWRLAIKMMMATYRRKHKGAGS